MKQTEYPDNFSRRRAERQRKMRKKRIITTFIAIIILLLVIGITLCFTVFFPIEKISVAGSKIYLAEEIIGICPIKTGDNMFAFSSEKLENEIRNKLPYILEVKVQRSLKGNLNLKVRDGKEKLCFENDKTFYTVGEDGFVINSYAELPNNLILIKGMDAKFKVGNYISYENEKKQKILEKLLSFAQQSKINEIDITEEYSISIVSDNRFDVSLGTSNNLEEKMAHLNSMVAKIGEEKSGKINLSQWSTDKAEGTFVENKEK